MNLAEIFSYGFLVRALVVGILVSLCSSLLGVSLVLKRYSMIGDGLSHVGFGALAVAAALGFAPLAVAVPVVVAAAFLLLRLGSKARGDASVAALSAGALATGVTVISLSRGFNTDLYNYLFGSILALGGADVVAGIALSAAVIIIFVFFYHKIFAVTFDETFAQASGVRAGFYDSIIAVLTAVTVVLGMRLMGALLISSLIIFPALSAMRLFKSFRAVTICAGIVSVACFAAGILFSFALSTPAGASVVLCNIAVLFFAFLLNKISQTNKKLMNRGV